MKKKHKIIAAIAAISVVTMVVYVNKLRKDSYCRISPQSTTGWCLDWQQDHPAAHAAALEEQKKDIKSFLDWQRRKAEPE